MPAYALVASADQAAENIRRFADEFERVEGLQRRVTLAHDWYAIRDDRRGWLFGHSKFVGRRNNSAAHYLRMAKEASGGATEARLKMWFEPVDPQSPLGRELDTALRDFLGRHGRVPRRSIRISVLSEELDNIPSVRRKEDEAALSRISSDPRICGGRPCIKGTRMRVSDIVDMLANGATNAEIVEDFPYIKEEDIAAALAFAARAVDHRVIRAA